MASDIRVWTGTAWQSIVGPAGPTVVSADAGNVAKLGADGRISVQPADLDSRFVNVTGDSMTGALSVTQNSGNSYVFTVINGQSYTYLNGATFTSAAFGPRPANDGFCSVRYGWSTLASNNDWSYDYSATGVTLTQRLAGVGTAKLAISSTGNITSPGTAHSFAAASIAASAISGLPAASAVVGTALAAAGAVGVSTAYARADHVHPLPAGMLTQATADTLYVNVTGDAMTGSLAVKPATIANGTVLAPSSGVKSDTTSSTGTNVAAFYAATIGDAADPDFTPKPDDYAFLSTGPAPSKLGGSLSVNGKVIASGDLIGDRPILNVTASTTLSLLFRSYTIANTSTGGGTVTITIPSNATAAFPIGTKFDILDLSATAPTIVAGAAGVTVQWNATLTGAPAAVAGGVAGSVQLPGPISKVTVYKVATDSWVVFN